VEIAVDKELSSKNGLLGPPTRLGSALPLHEESPEKLRHSDVSSMILSSKTIPQLLHATCPEVKSVIPQLLHATCPEVKSVKIDDSARQFGHLSIVIVIIYK